MWTRRASRSCRKSGGTLPPATVGYTEEHEIDLVVAGTRGRRGLQRMLTGSVAEEVLRTAPCPVLTVLAPLNEKTDD